GFDQLGSRSFAGSGFLVHLHSLTVTMTQKSSVVQILNSVPQVLTSDNFNYIRKTVTNASIARNFFAGKLVV
ncbi:hypothetical protein, partial [Tateyamaria sp.]|uniref:hypothetical protein n=1 Tax=Tateyamaria sp. TaxID=1929288 RepID=UPI00329CD24E